MTTSNGVRVLVCRVGLRPVVELLEPNDGDRDRGHLNAMQKIVGGLVEVITLDDGVDLWCNEEGMLLDLPINRVIPAAPRGEPKLAGMDVDFVIYADDDLVRPGEPGEWRIRGDFFLSRTDSEGELADIDDASIGKYTKLFDSEDIIMAQHMNNVRVKAEQMRGRHGDE